MCGHGWERTIGLGDGPLFMRGLKQIMILPPNQAIYMAIVTMFVFIALLFILYKVIFSKVIFTYNKFNNHKCIV